MSEVKPEFVWSRDKPPHPFMAEYDGIDMGDFVAKHGCWYMPDYNAMNIMYHIVKSKPWA